MRKKLIAGNWKMNGSLKENQALLQNIVHQLPPQVDGMVFAPLPYLEQVQSLLKNTGWQWGAQDVSAYPCGAYTGEVSAAMLCEFGVRAVLIGHSERRIHHHESNESIVQKTKACLSVAFHQESNTAFQLSSADLTYTGSGFSLTPIICLGETLQEREDHQTFDVIAWQLDPVIEALASSVINGKWSVVFAYEPVWAIGTGKTATAEQAQDVHIFIRDRLKTMLGNDFSQNTRILYGGSVKPSNVADLFAQPDIDGALVGGASLMADDFLEIIFAAMG